MLPPGPPSLAIGRARRPSMHDPRVPPGCCFARRHANSAEVGGSEKTAQSAAKLAGSAGCSCSLAVALKAKGMTVGLAQEWPAARFDFRAVTLVSGGHMPRALISTNSIATRRWDRDHLSGPG